MSSIGKIFLGDKYLWAFVLLLAVFSFLPVYSASSNLQYVVGLGTTFSHLIKHAFFLFVGISIMIGLQHVDYKYFGAFAVIGMPIVIVLLFITQLQGNTIDGANASRWLKIPGIPFTIQTSTLASLTLLVYIARYLTKRRNQEIGFKESILPLLLPTFAILVLIFPSNGSTAAILFVLSILMLFFGGYPIRYLIGIAFTGISIASLFIFVALKFPDVIPSSFSRVHTWQNRVTEFVEEGGEDLYQVKHAKAAIVQGGIFGKHPGKSSFKQSLPQSVSDFIYAIIVEEYGLVGGILLVFVYLMILFRVIIIATKIHTYFGTLLVFAAGFPIILQAFMNMAVAVNLLPVTGQPLPILSYGGTSLWINCVAFGIILSVSRQIKSKEEVELELRKNSDNYVQEIA